MTYIGRDNEPSGAYDTIQKFGLLPDMDANNTNEDVWDGTGPYNGWLSTNTAMTISGDSTDDASNGIGAQTVKVYGLIENLNDEWVVATETVSTNGTTGVSLSNSYIRIYRAHIVKSGSNDTNNGNIYIGSGSISGGIPENIYAQISAGRGQTLMAIYTVPDRNEDGESYSQWELIGWGASTGAVQAAFCTMALQTNENGAGWRTREIRMVSEGSSIDTVLPFGLDLAPKTDIRLRVLSNGVNNSQIVGNFNIRMRVK